MRHLALLLLFLGSALQPQEPAGWAQWRGPLGTGASPDAEPPLRIGENEGVAWKIGIPGEGSGTPVVWGETVYVSTAVPVEGSAYEFDVLAVATGDGAVRWKRTATTARPHEGRQPTNTYASHSAMVDATRVYAYFGSRGLFAYTHEGEFQWSVDLGDMETRRGFGEGNSPAMYGDTIVVPWDQELESFIVALDTSTGEERWRVARDEPTTWATPLLIEDGNRVQVITAGTRRVRSYDLADGSLLWEGNAKCQMPNAKCKLPIANCQLPIVICHLSFVICHLSFVICHLSFVICHFNKH